MKYLNLDLQFEPFGKTIGHKSFLFSGGEPHITINENLSANDQVMITTRIKTFNDMGLLLVAVDALRRMKIETISLFIPYFPGARQDRLMTHGEPLTVKVYAELINNLDLKEVVILDPHSEVTPALVKNVKVLTNDALVESVTKNLSDFHLVAPDAGALKKIYKTAQFIGHQDVIECGKNRDVLTGELSGFKVNYGDLKGQTCVIVDDICDGGGTFIGLAKELKKRKAGRLILIVTHGIFKKGTEELKELYDEIYCTDSFQNYENSEVNLIELSSLV